MGRPAQKMPADAVDARDWRRMFERKTYDLEPDDFQTLEDYLAALIQDRERARLAAEILRPEHDMVGYYTAMRAAGLGYPSAMRAAVGVFVGCGRACDLVMAQLGGDNAHYNNGTGSGPEIAPEAYAEAEAAAESE